MEVIGAKGEAARQAQRSAAWQRMSDNGRQQFLWPHPGVPRPDDPESDELFEVPAPSAEDSVGENFCLLVLEQGLASPENNLLARLATLRPGLYSAREVVTGLAATLLLPAIAVFSFGFVVAKALGLVRPPPSMPSPDASPNGSPAARAADRNQHGWDANDSAFSLDDS